MNIAIIHDSLNEFGGAERLLVELTQMFPEAHVFTTTVNDDIVKTFFPDVNPKNIHALFGHQRFFEHHDAFFQMTSPLWWSCLNVHNFDLVISSSSYRLSAIAGVHAPYHIQYIHCPPKNLFGLAETTPLQHIVPYTSVIGSLFSRRLKKSKYILTNSLHMQSTLQKIFHVKSTVIYPPVNVSKTLPKRKKPLYYLCVSRLDNTKGVELAIRASNALGLPLKIVGTSTSPEYYHFLQSIAGPTVEFLGFCSDKQISELYQHAIALLFTAVNEDFGIVPVEAMGKGIPVIAYYAGGPKETVIHGKTGLFFYEYTPESLIETLKKFYRNNFSVDILYNQARKFRVEVFRNRLQKYINQIIRQSE